ncbi:MAG: hypothetical protein HYW50_03755 [Candidatus Diapherotrites archaeon]|nr:hypothetical protein [Candidatus Diapherotrites archaeon]
MKTAARKPKGRQLRDIAITGNQAKPSKKADLINAFFRGKVTEQQLMQAGIPRPQIERIKNYRRQFPRKPTARRALEEKNGTQKLDYYEKNNYCNESFFTGVDFWVCFK